MASLAAILSLATAPTDQWDQAWQAARIPIGLIALLLVPGYTLALLLFPRLDDMGNFERAGVAVGLSLAQYPLLALGLDRSPWGLSPTAIIVSVTLLTWLWGLAAAVRLTFVAQGELFTHAWPPLLPLPRLSRLERLTLLAGLGVAAAIAWSVWLLITQPAVPPLTEFFALGSDGFAQNYPSTAGRNQPISVSLGVHNLEGQSVEYAIAARTDAGTLAEVAPFRVEPGETRTITVTFSLAEYGFGQRVDLLLYRSGAASEPYRRLALVVDVPQVGMPTPVRIAPTPAPVVPTPVPVVPTPAPAPAPEGEP
jgi:uncharacterized membrane protein